ncbi:MAG: hypothetical protein NVS2B16_22570 [Chloroflexota bacterium]
MLSLPPLRRAPAYRILCVLAVLPIALARPHMVGETAPPPTPRPVSTAPPAPSVAAILPAPRRAGVPVRPTPTARPTAVPPTSTAPPSAATPPPPVLRAGAHPAHRTIPRPHKPTEAPRIIAHPVRHAPAPVDLALHGVGTQLYTAWNAPITLKAINWYGFEYAPFVPDGLNRASLDAILGTVRHLGFNALRLTVADQTVRWNPLVMRGLDANPDLRGLHSLDIMQRIVERAHHLGLRVIVCNSRSEAGMGPEILSGLWYTAAYSESVWRADWEQLATRLRADSAFVGADLRNEPHETGSGAVDERTYLNNGPIWGAYRGKYYRDRDWRWAAERMGNDLLHINPHLLIIVEGVQMYLDPSVGTLTGGLWGSNLLGVRNSPVHLDRPGQLVYSVHEYGPQMWQGDWFNTTTTYASLAQRWTQLWGYLLGASRALQAPIFVGEFGTCHNYWSCISDTAGWKQGFWFSNFVRYLHAHPQIGWAYWSLNPLGPFHPQDPNFYSLVSPDWHHYYPLVVHGLAPLLAESGGAPRPSGSDRTPLFTPMPGCSPTLSCASSAPPPALLPVNVLKDVPYTRPVDPARSGDIYLPMLVGKTPRAAVVIVHGGSWDNGRKGSPGTVSLALSLARRGYVTFDINYRLSGQGGEYPKNIRDINDAVAYLSTRKNDLHIDPDKLAVVGVSSGGYLALMAAYRSHIPPFIAPHYPGVQARIRAVGAFFAPVALKATIRSAGDTPRVGNLAAYMGATYDEDPHRYKTASPMRYTDTAVPTILWYARSDPLTPAAQTFELYKRLKQRQIQSQLLDVPGAVRRVTELPRAAQDTALSQLATFLDAALSYHPSRAR